MLGLRAAEEKAYVVRPYALSLSRDLRPEGEPRRLTDRFYCHWDWNCVTPDSREIVLLVRGALAADLLWRLAVSGRSDPLRLPFATEDVSLSRHSSPRLVYVWYRQEANPVAAGHPHGERTMLDRFRRRPRARRPAILSRRPQIAFRSDRSGSRRFGPAMPTDRTACN